MPAEEFILKTKLIAPQVKAKILRRERLLNLLKENLDKKLILICAAAGYGKTTLLAQLCTEFDKPYMFYDLDASDNDLATFFNYITTGIQQQYSSFGRRTKAILAQTRNIEILVGTFINEFVEHSRKNPPIPPLLKGDKGGLSSSFIKNLPKKQEEISPHFYIILDDYHHLQQNKEIGNALDYLLRHLPQDLHLIMSSRSTPPLNLAYYFAKQELFRLEKKQLQFNLKEIQKLLKETYGLRIPEKEVTRIEKHSEGWITAIQLILQKISVAGEGKAKETLNGFVTSGEEIFNYFAREVFESQPKEVQVFLMKTSFLKWMTVDVCNYILQIKNANQILNYLETERIFVSRFDNKYKYHKLFKDFLLTTVTEFYGKKVLKSFYNKVGNWYEQRKDYILAIEYFTEGGLFSKAAKILEKFSWDLIEQGKMHMLFYLIGLIPDQIITNYPLLLVQKSKALRFLMNFNEALTSAKNALKLYKKRRHKNGTAEALSEISISHLELGQLKKALIYGKKALKYFPAQFASKKVKVLNIIGSIYRQLHKYQQAKKYLSSALRICNKTGDKFYEYLVKINLSLTYNKEGNLQESIGILEDIAKKLDLTTSTYPVMINLYINLSDIYIEMENYDNAKQFIEKAEEIADKFNDQRALAYIYGIRSKLYVQNRNFHQAHLLIEKVAVINKNLNDLGLNLNIYLDKANIYLAQNNLSDGFACIEKAKKFIRANTFSFRAESIKLLITESKFKYASQQRGAADKSLRQAQLLAKEIKPCYLHCKIFFELAFLRFKQNDYVRTTSLLRKALKLAKKKGYDFYLLRKAREDLSLFEFAIEHKIMVNYIKHILINLKSSEVSDLLKKIGLKQTTAKIDYTFEVHLLGSFNLQKNGTSIKIKLYKKTKALLCYFLLNSRKKITAEKLAELFWPEWESSHSFHNLHTHIFYIRRLFKNIVGGEEFIIYKSETYQINPLVNYKSDVSEFEELIKRAKNLENKDRNKSIKDYLQAIKIYKDDLLPSIFASWCEEKRIYYRELYRKALKKIIEHNIKKKNFEDSLILGKKLLNLDEFDESAHCIVMQCMAELGRKRDLIKHYEKLRETFKKEIGSLPHKKTIKTYKQLINP